MGRQYACERLPQAFCQPDFKCMCMGTGSGHLSMIWVVTVCLFGFRNAGAIYRKIPFASTNHSKSKIIWSGLLEQYSSNSTVVWLSGWLDLFSPLTARKLKQKPKFYVKYEARRLKQQLWYSSFTAQALYLLLYGSDYPSHCPKNTWQYLLHLR